MQILLYSGLSFGSHPEREELAGRRRRAPFKNVNALTEIKRVGIGKNKTDGGAVFNHTQGSIVVDAAIKSVFAGGDFFQTFGLPAYQDRFVLDNSPKPFQLRFGSCCSPTIKGRVL